LVILPCTSRCAALHSRRSRGHAILDLLAPPRLLSALKKRPRRRSGELAQPRSVRPLGKPRGGGVKPTAPIFRVASCSSGVGLEKFLSAVENDFFKSIGQA